MEPNFRLMKCLFIVHIACLQISSAQSGMRPRVGWRRGVDWTGNTQPKPQERRRYLFDAGATGQIGTDYSNQGFGGFSRRKAVNRDHMVHYGRFNSDTHGCHGIQTRSCNANSRCTGCLGLYTCNLSLGQCQLKGLSQRTDKFLQTLQNF